MKLPASIAVLLLLPSLALGASFAKQSLFLSKSAVTEGETVLIHAIVSNDSATKFSGTLKLSDETGAIGSVPVALSAEEAQAVSVSWKPSAGSHTVVAKLEDASGALAEQESAIFTISPKPQPAAATQTAAVDSSQNIQQAIQTVSPAVAEAAQPVFAAIDQGRARASDAIGQGINWAKQQISPGAVLSADTSKATPSKPGGVGGTLWTIMATLALYILSVLQFVVNNAGIFYPALAALFFYFLWRMYKRYRRPAWQR
jgi:hypothetical protein